jgi:hypothetical protein
MSYSTTNSFNQVVNSSTQTGRSRLLEDTKEF